MTYVLAMHENGIWTEVLKTEAWALARKMFWEKRKAHPGAAWRVMKGAFLVANYRPEWGLKPKELRR